MDSLILCNATAVRASVIVDDDVEATSDRLVTFAMGTIDDHATSEMIAGLILTPDEARELAQELLTAASSAEGTAPLPLVDLSGAPMGSC